MAHQPPDNLLCLLGIVSWGDLGPLTLYRNKRKQLVAFAKTWPKKPASADQQVQRQKFIDAAIAWQALTPEKRGQWELATLRSSLAMHGYDLWVHWQLIGDDDAIRTLQRQTRTDLIPV